MIHTQNVFLAEKSLKLVLLPLHFKTSLKIINEPVDIFQSTKLKNSKHRVIKALFPLFDDVAKVNMNLHFNIYLSPKSNVFDSILPINPSFSHYLNLC